MEVEMEDMHSQATVLPKNGRWIGPLLLLFIRGCRPDL